MYYTWLTVLIMKLHILKAPPSIHVIIYELLGLYIIQKYIDHFFMAEFEIDIVNIAFLSTSFGLLAK